MRSLTRTVPASPGRALFLVLAALLVAASASSGPAVAASAGGAADRVREAVDELFKADAERVEFSAAMLAAQDVIRQEMDVCIDPPGRRLTAGTRMWIESSNDEVRLLLNESLTVVSVTDSRRTELEYVRSGDTLRVLSPPDLDSFPLEIEIRYEGVISPTPNSLVSDSAIAVAPGFHWYPVSPWRDPARLAVEVRYPQGYTSVISGALSGMAPTTQGGGECVDGDLWDVPTPVTGAGLVVGTVESSLTVVGGVFVGYHVVVPDEGDAAPFGARSSATAVPQELTTLLRYLENCYGPYPYAWLNVVLERVPDAAQTSVMTAPGLVLVRSSQAGLPLDLVASGLSHSWWTYWMDPGPLFSRGLATHTRIGWLEATGEEDAAIRLRGFRQAQYARAVAESSEDAPLAVCFGPDAARDERTCAAKGSAVLEMLTHVIGEESLCEGLRALTAERGGGSPDLREIVLALERASGADLRWFVYEWLLRSDLPSYALEYETIPREDGTFLVRGSIMQEGEFFRTPVPLTIDLGGWAYEEVVEIGSSHQPFELVTVERPIGITLDTRHLIPRISKGERAEMHYRRGMDAVGRQAYAVALDELGAAASYEPTNATYLTAYGSTLVRLGRLADGLAVQEMVVELQPGSPDRRSEIADLYLRSRDYASALEHLDAYVTLRPDDRYGQVKRSLALTGLGRLSEADDALERADALFEEQGREPELDEEFALATGILAEARGDTEAAVRAYESVLLINPVSDDARRRLRALKLP